MSADPLSALLPDRIPWNKRRIVGHKRPLLPRHFWSNRVRLEMAGNLRAVQLSLGHTKKDSRVRYFGVDVEGALTLSEGIDLRLPPPRPALSAPVGPFR